MDEVKSWLTSKTIWGAVIALVATALRMLGVVDISGDEQNSLLETVFNLVTAIGAIGGSLLAIYGRITAKTQIG